MLDEHLFLLPPMRFLEPADAVDRALGKRAQQGADLIYSIERDRLLPRSWFDGDDSAPAPELAE